WDPKDKKNNVSKKPPTGYIKISSEKNKSLAPLGGLYGPQIMVEALYELGDSKDLPSWLRIFSKLTGISMAAQTVGAVPRGPARNCLGNLGFILANGNFTLDKAGNLEPAAKTFAVNIFRMGGDDARRYWQGRIEEYIAEGIIGESVGANVLRDLL